MVVNYYIKSYLFLRGVFSGHIFWWSCRGFHHAGLLLGHVFLLYHALGIPWLFHWFGFQCLAMFIKSASSLSIHHDHENWLIQGKNVLLILCDHQVVNADKYGLKSHQFFAIGALLR